MDKQQYPHKSTTHEEKFFHFQTPDSKILKAITVFARKEDDGRWYAAGAFCVKGDEFNRKIGRTVARRRYFSYPDDRLHLPMSSDDSFHYELLRTHCLQVANG